MTLCFSHKKEDPFARIDRRIIKDSRLSWKAKGILLYAFDQSSEWKFYKSEMMKHAKDGKESFDSGIKELEFYGYLYRTKSQGEKGKFTGWEWHFFEIPVSLEEFKKMFPKHGKPVSRETPISVKPAPNKNNCSNENKSNDCFDSDQKKEINSSPEGVKSNQKELLVVRTSSGVESYNIKELIPRMQTLRKDFGKQEIIEGISIVDKKDTIINDVVKYLEKVIDNLKKDTHKKKKQVKKEKFLKKSGYGCDEIFERLRRSNAKESKRECSV